MNNNITNKIIGTVLVLVAGILWGFSGTCAQYMFETFDVKPEYLTSARMLAGGSILTIYALITKGKIVFSVFKKPGTIVHLLLFAIFGIGAVQLTYMMAIRHSDSATATILQYVGPVIIMLIYCVMHKVLPKAKEYLALTFALLGIVTLTTQFDFSSMNISNLGLFWGLLSALGLAGTTLIPGGLVKKFGSIVVTGLAMLLGGILLATFVGLWNAPIINDPRCLLAFGAIVVLGTIIPFTSYFFGLVLVGPVKAGILSTVEPLAATFFMLLWLDGIFHPIYDTLGFALILGSVLLLTKKEKEKKNEKLNG